MKTILKKGQHYISPELLAVLLAAILSGVLLFVPPINGLADNGDFYRAMLSNGLYRLPSHVNQYLDYVIPKFGIYQYFNENKAVVMTSQTLFVRAAILLNKLFYSHTVFDIRFLGAVYEVFYLGAIYLLTKSLVYPFRKLRSYIVALIVVFVFADASFTLYFNSFFGEPEMYIAALYSFAAIMSLARHCYRRNWPMVLLFFVSTILVITSKQQNAPLALSYMVVAAGLLFLPHFKARKLAIMLGMGTLAVSGVLTYASINKDFNNWNLYQSFTHGVLMETSDPSRKIAKDGQMSERFALMRTQDYYAKTFDPVKPTGKMVEKNLLNHYSMGWVIKYYARNQRQFLNLMDLASKDVMITQVKAVGDYPAHSGHRPGEQTKFFTLYSTYMGAFFPGKFAFICLLAVAFTAVYAVSAYLDFKAGRIMGILRFCQVAGLMTIFVFVPIISIIGDGDADLAKHLFMASLSLDLVLVLFASDLLNHRLWLTEEGGEADE